jgi:hypothetical protein
VTGARLIQTRHSVFTTACSLRCLDLPSFSRHGFEEMAPFKSCFSRRLSFWKSRGDAQHHVKYWYPLALRWWNLTCAIALCWIFIAVLQYLLIQSHRDGGIIFATDINELSLGLTFSYRYLPTLIAVTFSIIVLWIDNDARRYEPYRLMLRPGGAPARDSVLLHYPYNFMPFVPFKSFRKG